jgi:hypothetical protein
MEISANTSHSQLSSQQNAERVRDESKSQLQSNQVNTQVEAQDKATSAAPVEETSASAQTENRNNEQVTRQAAPSTDETIGGQLDIRA